MPSDSPKNEVRKRVTLRDIAKVAGLHFTTVGMALRGNREIPPATQERVRKIAEELGYRPDPMLAALNAYRRNQEAPHFQATLAWVNNWPKREDLQKNLSFRYYYEGAKHRAEQLGYKLEEFWLHEKGMTPSRFTGILRARNISALLMAPQAHSNTSVDLDYSDFAVLSFGYSLQPAVFHVVTNHHFHSMNLLVREVCKLGYKRIGLFASADWNRKVENCLFGTMAMARTENPDIAEVPPLVETTQTGKKEMKAWLKAAKPDVVVSHGGGLKLLRSLGYSIPEDIGFANFSIWDTPLGFSGIHQNDFRIGEVAVNVIVSMLHSGERGIPKTPMRILIESDWEPGATLRPQK